MPTPPVASQAPAQVDAPIRIASQEKEARTGSPVQSEPGIAKRRKQGAISKPTAARGKKAVQAKAKQVVKKKRHKRKKATALARRVKKHKAPPRRAPSLTERLNAALAACRARPHAPGECNLRACDVAGKSDPACR